MRKRFEEKMAEERVVKVSGGVGAVKRFVVSKINLLIFKFKCFYGDKFMNFFLVSWWWVVLLVVFF